MSGADYRVDPDDGAGHIWHADEPASLGGGDSSPTPDHPLRWALGACTAITVRMYAAHKEWPLEAVGVELALDPDGKPGTGTEIARTIHLRGPLDADQRERLLQIANACPIHRLLTGEVRVASTLGA